MGGRDLMAGVATMTSREIAELTGKQHQHVKRDVEKMLAELGVDASNFGHIYVDGMNRPQTEFALDRELTDTLLTGYSAVLRRKVIARWRELESEGVPQFIVPTTLSGALRLAAEQAETIEAQTAQLAIAAPAVAFVDNYVIRSTGSLGFRAVAKLIHAKENAFRDFLKSEKIMYQLGGTYHAYAAHLDAGRFEVRTGTTADGIETKGHAFTQTLFTPKGVSWVAGEWAKHQISNRDGSQV